MSAYQMKSSWNIFGCSIWQFNKEMNADIAEGWIAMHWSDMEKKKKGEGYSTEDMNAYTLLLEIRVPPERQRFYPEPLTFKEPPAFWREGS